MIYSSAVFMAILNFKFTILYIGIYKTYTTIPPIFWYLYSLHFLFQHAPELPNSCCFTFILVAKLEISNEIWHLFLISVFVLSCASTGKFSGSNVHSFYFSMNYSVCLFSLFLCQNVGMTILTFSFGCFMYMLSGIELQI